ncbi:hypothetical protein YN1_1480 [Nanoarchaeota archaeon]
MSYNLDLFDVINNFLFHTQEKSNCKIDNITVEIKKLEFGGYELKIYSEKYNKNQSKFIVSININYGNIYDHLLENYIQFLSYLYNGYIMIRVKKDNRLSSEENNYIEILYKINEDKDKTIRSLFDTIGISLANLNPLYNYVNLNKFKISDNIYINFYSIGLDPLIDLLTLDEKVYFVSGEYITKNMGYNLEEKLNRLRESKIRDLLNLDINIYLVNLKKFDDNDHYIYLPYLVWKIYNDKDGIKLDVISYNGKKVENIELKDISNDSLSFIKFGLIYKGTENSA